MPTLGSPSMKALPILAAVLCVAMAIPAVAQQASSSPATQDDINKQLVDRIQELEKQVQTLKAQPPAPEPAPVVEAPAVNEVAPRLKMQIFGDVGLQGYNGSDTSFFFGSFDLFMTARLSSKFSALGEVLFVPDVSNNSLNVDVTRLLLRYRQNDYFSASIGRYNTLVGYYNTAFNKGEFLETTADRPFIYAFDDFGGLLPMQDVGVNVTGKIPSGKLGLHYVFEMGNGRPWGIDVEPAQNRQDANTSKAVNGGLYMRPEQVSGLQVGFSLRHDNLSIPGPAVHETIVTAHVVYVNNTWEILNEAVLDRHDEIGITTFNTVGGYSQFSRRFKAYRPYFRYQYFNAPYNDPVYAFAPQNDYAPATYTGFVARLNGPSVGVRYDFNEHAAFKFQYDRFSLRDLPSENGLTTQIAFTF